MKTYSQQQKLAVVRNKEGAHFHLQVQKQTKPVATGGKTSCLAQQSISHTLKGALSFPKAGLQHGDKQSDFRSVEGQDTV